MTSARVRRHLKCRTPGVAPTNSKSEPHSELNDPGQSRVAITSKRVRVSEGGRKSVELRPIEDVEELTPKLETHGLGKLEVFENRKVFHRISEGTNVAQLVGIRKGYEAVSDHRIRG